MINRPNHGSLCRRMIAFAIHCCVLVILLAASRQCMANETLSQGSSSKHLRKQTVNSLPYHQLNQQTKDKIAEILTKPSIYRQLPVTAINTDPDYFRFLVRYPEVIVNIWQLMGVTNMSTERTGAYSLMTNDGAGTVSTLELIYGNDNLHIFYGTGTYEGPILKRKLNGKCVLVLQSESKMDVNGNPVTTSKLDVFLKVDNATAGMIAKTIQPLVGTTADHNFVESLKFVERLNETTSKNGPGVQRMGERLEIDAGVRQKFNEVVDVVFQRAINGPASNDTRGFAPPASVESSSSTHSQALPSLNLQNALPPQSQNGYPAPGYQQPNEMEQFHSVVPNQNAYYYGDGNSPNYAFPGRVDSKASSYPMNLPARGYQAPRYPNLVVGTPGYRFSPAYYYPAVQTNYEDGQSVQGSIQSTGGWRSREP